jgi:site-specific recombinase XerD
VSLYQGTWHSFVTQHLDQLALVSKVLGHTNVSMTKRYEGINLDKIREMVK